MTLEVRQITPKSGTRQRRKRFALPTPSQEHGQSRVLLVARTNTETPSPAKQYPKTRAMPFLYVPLSSFLDRPIRSTSCGRTPHHVPQFKNKNPDGSRGLERDGGRRALPRPLHPTNTVPASRLPYRNSSWPAFGGTCTASQSGSFSYPSRNPRTFTSRPADGTITRRLLKVKCDGSAGKRSRSARPLWARAKTIHAAIPSVPCRWTLRSDGVHRPSLPPGRADEMRLDVSTQPISPRTPTAQVAGCGLPCPNTTP